MHVTLVVKEYQIEEWAIVQLSHSDVSMCY